MSLESIESTVKKLANTLMAQKGKLAVAESCTGGWIAKVITDLSGSSEWFDRGFVTYSNQSKQQMLDVPDDVISLKGAVCQETVEAMAKGVVSNSIADFGLAVSGIAGPGGGSAEKPVGLVWFAWANKEGMVASEKKIFEGNRDAVRMQAVEHALVNCLEFILRSCE